MRRLTLVLVSCALPLAALGAQQRSVTLEEALRMAAAHFRVRAFQEGPVPGQGIGRRFLHARRIAALLVSAGWFDQKVL